MIILLIAFAIQITNRQSKTNQGETKLNKFITLIAGILLLLSTTGCSPEVGSEAWCKKLADKPKGDWTVNETTEYTKNCIFK
jgi:hypothetical protein